MEALTTQLHGLQRPMQLSDCKMWQGGSALLEGLGGEQAAALGVQQRLVEEAQPQQRRRAVAVARVQLRVGQPQGRHPLEETAVYSDR